MNPLNIIWIYLLAFGMWVLSIVALFMREDGISFTERLQTAGEMTLFPLSLAAVIYGTIWIWQFGWAEAVLGFILFGGLHWFLLSWLFERHYK